MTINAENQEMIFIAGQGIDEVNELLIWEIGERWYKRPEKQTEQTDN